jgi:hypothetical protein
MRAILADGGLIPHILKHGGIMGGLPIRPTRRNYE